MRKDAHFRIVGAGFALLAYPPKRVKNRSHSSGRAGLFALALSSFLFLELPGARAVEPPQAYGATPAERQVRWENKDLIGIVHLSLNTWTGKEWGYGDESPNLFNPEQFDARQIVRAAKAGGLQRLVLVAKHHVGFCLWPSKYNDNFTVKNSPWRGGQGDLVREFVDACHAEGVEVGLYLSPWDRNRADYGQPGYVEYYHNQLRELLSNYGEVDEVWFDGANGGDGFYGGARTKRPVNGGTYYEWDAVMKIVRELQPQAACFGREDIRWVGNEKGFAGDPCWAMKGATGQNGDRHGSAWMPAEADFPLRNGWFWHPDGITKSPADLLNRYFTTAGRNAVMDLGIAPDTRGLICDEDLAALQGFGDRLRAIFATNLAATAKVSASNVRGNDPAYAAGNLLDGHGTGKYWATDDAVTNADAVADFGKPVTFSVVSLREQIQLGQRVDTWALDAWQNGQWQEFATGTGIGAHRLWRGEPVVTEKLRLRITGAAACPALSELAVYLEPEASRRESAVALKAAFNPGLPHAGWKINSSVAAGTGPELAMDGHAKTVWQTDASTGSAAPPSLTVDMGQAHALTGFLYLPRQDGRPDGIVTKYAISVSADGHDWGQPVAQGEFGNIAANPVQQRVKFKAAVTARYFRFTALEASGKGVTVAEIGVTGK